MCGFQVPTQLKNIFAAARLGRQQSSTSPCRAGVLPYYHRHIETPEQRAESTPDRGRKSVTGTQGSPAHTPQCLRHEGTQPHRLRTGSAPPWVPGGRRELLQQRPRKGDGIGPDPWGARGEGEVSPAPAQPLCCRTAGGKALRMEGCCAGMWDAGQLPAGAKDGGGYNGVTAGSRLASLSHGHPTPGAELLQGCSGGHWVTGGEDTRVCGAAGVC